MKRNYTFHVKASQIDFNFSVRAYDKKQARKKLDKKIAMYLKMNGEKEKSNYFSKLESVSNCLRSYFNGINADIVIFDECSKWL